MSLIRTSNMENSTFVNNAWNNNRSIFSPNIWTPITLEKQISSESTEKEYIEDILIKQLLDNNYNDKYSKLLNTLKDNVLSKEILDIIIKEIPELKYQKPELILRLETSNSKFPTLDLKDLKTLLSKYGNITYLQ